MAYKLLAIDESTRSAHYYLTEDDECFFFGDYQARGGYDAGPINGLIYNFKKSVLKRDRPEYQFKEQAIRTIGGLLGKTISVANRVNWTIVPIPTSRTRDDPEYDDRLLRAIRAAGADMDLRELIMMKKTARSHHAYGAGEKRPTPDDLYARLSLDTKLIAGARQKIILFDDILTAGTHFKACKRLLLEHLPGCQVIGIFIGRTVRPDAVDFSSLFD